MRVKRTRNQETWTEAKYWGSIRSALRRNFRFWKAISATKINSRRKYTGDNKNQKFEYQCSFCENWFKSTEVEVDHVEPCGSLKSYEDIAGFIKRLTSDDLKDYQTLCKGCHLEKTIAERNKRKLCTGIS